jgi:hypothetical protein
MSYSLIDLFSFSIAIAAIIGLVRFKQLDRVYFPFILLLWLGLLKESIDSIMIQQGFSNAVSSNLYSLAESLLLLWFFKRWGSFSRRPWVFPALAGIFIVAWILEKLVFTGITRFSSYFIILYSFTIVLLSIGRVNRLILSEKKMLINQPQFLIFIGFIIFYTYSLLVEIFWIYGLNGSAEFRVQIYRILAWINLFVNLIFALSLLWIPRKREYTLL